MPGADADRSALAVVPTIGCLRDMAALIRWPHKLVGTNVIPRSLRHRRDPAEGVDLTAEKPELAAQLRTELATRLKGPADPLASATLRALGYVQ